MKVLLQRVQRAEVRVEGDSVGRIGPGLLAMVCAEIGDNSEDVDYMAQRTASVRIFADDRGRMNLSLEQVRGAVLVVSQFTLAASTRRGLRPSYSAAAPPEIAEPFYERFIERLRERGLSVECGVFRAMMQVELVNDGPVTLMLDARPSASLR